MGPQYRYDMPDNYYFGGGPGTFITPLALLLLLVGILGMLLFPRRKMLICLLVIGLVIPFDINVQVGSIHFPGIRLLLAAAWIRVWVRKDIAAPKWSLLDTGILAWAMFNSAAFSLCWADFGAVNNRVGFLWTHLGTYFILRYLISDKEDALLAVKVFAVFIAVVAVPVMVEHMTQVNMFSIVGSPPISAMREGSIRAEGPFRHPVIAGTISAMLIPLFIGLWWQGRQYRIYVAAGVIGSLMIAIASASSTPLMTVAAGILGLLFWRFREHMRVFRWALVLTIAGVQLVMKAPVWMLIARTGGAIGGSGYHRAMLIDTFVGHFGEWWLVGTRSNADWGFDMWDVDNAYVAAGIGGGLLTFFAFIALFAFAFRQIGKARKLTSGAEERFVWAMGASLFAITVGYFGIVLFDQSLIIWYAMIAMIAITVEFAGEKAKAEPEREGVMYWGQNRGVTAADGRPHAGWFSLEQR